jgi:plasmid maintenance system antidote protein VapI
MKFQLEKYKGLHPGIVLDRLLTKKSILQRPFAISIGEHPQTLNAITKGKRKLNTPLALKIEAQLGLEEGCLSLLQTYYDIAVEKKKTLQTPNLSVFRKSLFWDTDIAQIDWQKQYKSVIQRINKRGNEAEKKELERFYGALKIKSISEEDQRNAYTIYKNKNWEFIKEDFEEIIQNI